MGTAEGLGAAVTEGAPLAAAVTEGAPLVALGLLDVPALPEQAAATSPILASTAPSRKRCLYLTDWLLSSHPVGFYSFWRPTRHICSGMREKASSPPAVMR